MADEKKSAPNIPGAQAAWGSALTQAARHRSLLQSQYTAPLLSETLLRKSGVSLAMDAVVKQHDALRASGVGRIAELAAQRQEAMRSTGLNQIADVAAKQRAAIESTGISQIMQAATKHHDLLQSTSLGHSMSAVAEQQLAMLRPSPIDVRPAWDSSEVLAEINEQRVRTATMRVEREARQREVEDHLLDFVHASTERADRKDAAEVDALRVSNRRWRIMFTVALFGLILTMTGLILSHI